MPTRPAEPRRLGRRVVIELRPGDPTVISARSFRPPGPLGKRGRRIWRELVETFAASGVLYEGHRRPVWLLAGVLEQLEEVRSWIVSAREKAQNQLAGAVWRTKSGYPIRAPWFDAEAKLVDQAARLLASIGVTAPAESTEPEARDKITELILRPRRAYKSPELGVGRAADTAGMPI